MKGVYGTTVNEEDVQAINNAIISIAMGRKGISFEIIETAVMRVKELYITDALFFLKSLRDSLNYPPRTMCYPLWHSRQHQKQPSKVNDG